MKIRYTPAQLQLMLRIATRTIPETLAMYRQTGVIPTSLEAMARGQEQISGAVLKFFGLESAGKAYVSEVSK